MSDATARVGPHGAPVSVHAVELSPVQHDIFTHPARFRFMVTGRRLGKTFLMGVESYYEAARAPGGLVWYVAPTYRMARDIAWESFVQLMSPHIRRTNETRLEITLTNNSIVALKGADNPDSLRGRGLRFAALDEYSLMDGDLFDTVMLPMLSTTQGRALFGMTPMGFNHAYDRYQAITSGALAGWHAWQLTTAQGGRVPASEIAYAAQVLDPRIFRQEYAASFETLAGRVYDQFLPAHLDASINDTGAEILVGLDFNVNPMSCVLASMAGNQLHVWDELEVPSSNTDEVADAIRARFPGRAVIVCPDPSGRARKTSAGGATDFTILEARGFYVDAPNAAPLVKDRINVVQAAFKQDRMRVHPRCAALRRALDGLTYKTNTNLPDKSSGLDHITDALGYLVWQRMNVLTPAWGTVRTRA